MTLFLEGLKIITLNNDPIAGLLYQNLQNQIHQVDLENQDLTVKVAHYEALTTISEEAQKLGFR